ncbi:MAG: hypothetical protein AAFQ79_07215 [Pseudomonadota bacterium]
MGTRNTGSPNGPSLLKAYLRGPAANTGPLTATALRRATRQAAWQVQAFYLFFLLLSFDMMRRVYALVGTDQVVTPLWPVAWVTRTGLDAAATTICGMLMISALAALWRPYDWWPRLLAAVSLLQGVALMHSFGSINHSLHYPLWVAFLMLLAPAARAPEGTTSISTHMRWLIAIFTTQVAVALFYTLSGLHKLYYGFFPNDVSSFAPEALPLLVMNRWYETGNEPMLAALFADNLALAWPAYLLVIYFELVFLVAVFRPQLHRIFGFVFVVFHTGVWLVIGITFPYQPIMVALLFLWSPFAEMERLSLRQLIAQLPGVDLIVWAIRRRARGLTADAPVSG